MLRIVRRIMRVLFYLVLAVVAAGLGALVVLTTPERGRENLAGIVSSLASTPERKVTLGGISGIWSGALRLDHVVVEDKAGPWLVMRDVAVDWSPAALLSKTFRAERVAAGRVELARLPQEETKPQAKESGPFTLPVSVDVRQIDLPDIALGEALAGAGVAELAAKGSLGVQASPLAVSTDLNITRRDGKEGAVAASIHFAPADNRLDLDVKASEPSGGIIANLLKLPGTPSVDITLSGNGPLEDWSGNGSFSIDGQVVTQLSGHHQLTDKGNHIEAKGDGDFARFVPDRLKPLLAGKVEFDLAGTATAAGGVEIEHATVESNALHGAAKGTIDPKGASDFALEFTSVGPTLPLSLGSEDSPIDIELKSASLRALGQGRSPAVDIAVSAAKIATRDVKVDNVAVSLHSDAFDIESRTGPISGTASADRIGFDNPTVAPLIAGKIAAKVAGKLEKDTIVVDSGSIRSDALEGGFDGRVSLADGSIELNVKADAASAALPAAARRVLGERTTLSAALRRDASGNVTADSLELSSGAVSASGKASLTEGQIAADLKGALTDLSLLSKDASGAVDLAVTHAKSDPRTTRFSGLVNGVLRTLARAKDEELEPTLAVTDDAPAWFAQRLAAAYGGQTAKKILAAHRHEAPVDFTVKADPDLWAERLGGIVLPTGTVRVADLAAPVAELPGFAEGAWWVQDAAASLPARLLGDIAGLRVADLCAAPGGKTAQLVLAGARVTAVDASKNRLARLAQNLGRLGLEAGIVQADLFDFEPAEPFDAVLLDAPCSSTGTVRRHPDVPWTKTPADIEKLADLQRRLLARAVSLVRPGGRVVFSNCSLDPLEGEELRRTFLAATPGVVDDPVRPGEFAGIDPFLTAQGTLRTTPAGLDLGTPELSGLDGFFAARFCTS